MSLTPVAPAPPGPNRFKRALSVLKRAWRQLLAHARGKWAVALALPRELFFGSDEPSDFEKSVTVVLATFTVFTGYTLNRFLTDIETKDPWVWWAFFALVALMLRYIFGSAIHLNATYVGKTAYELIPIPPPPATWTPKKTPAKSQSVFLLFKDFLFLVAFGPLAVHITGAANVEEFARRSMLFIAAGFAWSITDYYFRRGLYRFSPRGQRDSFSLIVVDLAFFVLFAWMAGCAYQVGYDAFSGGKDIDPFLWRCVIVVGTGVVFCIINGFVARPPPDNIAAENAAAATARAIASERAHAAAAEAAARKTTAERAAQATAEAAAANAADPAAAAADAAAADDLLAASTRASDTARAAADADVAALVAAARSAAPLARPVLAALGAARRASVRSHLVHRQVCRHEPHGHVAGGDVHGLFVPRLGRDDPRRPAEVEVARARFFPAPPVWRARGGN